jgi:hypothetical protein
VHTYTSTARPGVAGGRTGAGRRHENQVSAASDDTPYTSHTSSSAHITGFAPSQLQPTRQTRYAVFQASASTASVRSAVSCRSHHRPNRVCTGRVCTGSPGPAGRTMLFSRSMPPQSAARARF